MTRPFAWLSVGLAAAVGVLVGVILAGPLSATPTVFAPAPAAAIPLAPQRDLVSAPFPASFADVAERANPAVVSLDVASRTRRRSGAGSTVDGTPTPAPRRGEAPRRGTGTGFLFDAAGHVLTNQHVVDAAERISVKLADGRSFRATVVGADPDTDVAVLQLEGASGLPFLPLGDSERLRVGEWVCAIGNPLAYEHTVTVGVVSFVGRKLFDQSLDHYIQTDAAISFGNSGGPLLNTAGEVVGINSAVSRQANNIGFSIPINQAKEILPQLLESGRVSRGYLGVALRDVDADLQQALSLGETRGALVQDVTPGSPAARAGLRPYDVITAVDGEAVDGDDRTIRAVARGTPGSTAHLEFVRDGRRQNVVVKLAERPARVQASRVERGDDRPRQARDVGPAELGLTVIEVDAGNAARYDVPTGVEGLLVQRVEPLSAAADAGIERGQIILQMHRQPVTTVASLRRVVQRARGGEPMAVLVFDTDLDQRLIRVLHADAK